MGPVFFLNPNLSEKILPPLGQTMSNNSPTNLQTLLHAPHSHSPSDTFSLVIPAQEKWYHLNLQFCSWALSLIGKNINQHNTLMSSILKPPLGMRKHMDTTHSPQSSFVHECQNLTNPPPHGQNWCNKKTTNPPPPRTQKGAKTLSNPHQCPILPRGGGFNWQVHYENYWLTSKTKTNLRTDKEQFISLDQMLRLSGHLYRWNRQKFEH